MKTIKTLYVIDDDKIYHFLFKNLLKQNGIDVATTFFANGLEAIEHIKKVDNDNLPDLILLDINMPIMNGWQFLEEFIRIKDGFAKNSVVYMISSSNNEVDLDLAKDYGNVVKGYVLKPVCKDDLDRIFV